MQERLLCEFGNFILLDSVFGFMAHVQGNFQILKFHLKMIEQFVERYYCFTSSSETSVVGFSLLLPVNKCSVKFKSKKSVKWTGGNISCRELFNCGNPWFQVLSFIWGGRFWLMDLLIVILIGIKSENMPVPEDLKRAVSVWNKGVSL